MKGIYVKICDLFRKPWNVRRDGEVNACIVAGS